MKIARYNNFDPVNLIFLDGSDPKDPYIVIDTVPSDYTDVSSVTNFHQHGENAGLDFQQRHLEINQIVQAQGFGTLSNTEKDIVGIYCATDDNTLVTHYATTQTAGNVEQALIIHSDKMGQYISELQIVAAYRVDHPETVKSVMLYLKDRAQIDIFIAAIRNFVADYKSKFHVGTGYGDSTDGLLDYIENTGGYSAAGTGLDSYDFSDIYKQIWYDANAVDPANPTQAEQDAAHAHVRDLLKVKLKDILVYGHFG